MRNYVGGDNAGKATVIVQLGNRLYQVGGYSRAGERSVIDLVGVTIGGPVSESARLRLSPRVAAPG